ncbi:MAG: AgmX/PglI C-terminal domain-containing protein [Bdellovibrionaceae bacterium]|nr:AgmX/PglI C-terminal domain-containing protein [Pseudobdellovibrionaceae bacterium]
MSKPIVIKIFRNGGVVDIKQFVHEPQIIIGSSDADTHIKLEGQVSPFHASIEKRGEKFVLSDLGTPQGTYLKGNKVLESNLEHGDKIAIGEYILEFYVGAPVISASSIKEDVASSKSEASTTSVSLQEEKKTPMIEETKSSPANKSAESTHASEVSVTPLTSVVTVSSAGGLGAPTYTSAATPMSGVKKGEKTFAPASHYKDLNEFIRPTKGSTVEVLVSWRERVISSYHFHNKGTFYYGSHPGCDIVVPSLTSKVSRAPLLQIDGQASVFVPPGLLGSLVVDNQSFPLTQLYSQGRLQSAGGGGSKLTLSQGEMVRLHLGSDVELVIRYCSETPKPVFIPMIDFTSNGFLALLLAIILAVVVSLYVALNKIDKPDTDEEEYRTALIIENPPPPPPPVPQTKVEPPKVEEKKVEEPPKKVKQIDKKPAEKPKITEQKKPVEKKTPVKQQPAQKAGGGNGAPAQSMKPNPNKPKSNQVGSVKQGGSVKTAPKDGAQAESQTKDPSKSGIFGVFGSGGKQKTLDNTYSGSGQLAGLADQATGQSGFGEDRAGEGLGSKFKETGGGNGKSNVGVSGISSGKGLGMGTGGFGGVGLGGKGSVTILPGGDGESYGGNIDRNGIRQVFINNQRAIQNCYEKALSGDKGLSGKLVLDFDIGEQGRVLRADYSRSKSTLSNNELATCVLNRMKGWRFPEPPGNQTVQVFYPLAFSSK